MIINSKSSVDIILSANPDFSRNFLGKKKVLGDDKYLTLYESTNNTKVRKLYIIENWHTRNLILLIFMHIVYNLRTRIAKPFGDTYQGKLSRRWKEGMRTSETLTAFRRFSEIGSKQGRRNL